MTDWTSCLENTRGRFTLEWFREHVATKELLKAGPFHGNVLDVGCGIGGRTYIVAESYPAALVQGIDKSFAGIEHARGSFNLENIRYHVCDATQMFYYDNWFDFAYTLGVIEHIPDTARFLSEINRVLKPGGKFFLSVTEENYHSDSEHVHSFTLETAIDAIEAGGFTVESGYVKDHIIFIQARKSE